MKKILFLYFLILPGIIFAQNAGDIISSLQTKFKTINDFSADFNFSSELTNGNNSSGKFFFKKTNNFRVEFKSRIIVSDGIIIWNYDKNQNRVLINNLSDDPSSFSLEHFVFDLPKVCEKKYSGKKDNSEIVQLIPKSNEYQFEWIKLWKNSSNLLSKVKIKNFGSNPVMFEFSNVKVNQKLSDNKFNFEPPKGSKIIDLR